MSLRVWLPLNGNLNNQGLSNVTVTNNGATIDNNGKIGKCYYFNGSAYFNTGYGSGLSTNEKSIALWVKPSDTNASKMIFRTTGTSPGRFYFGIKNATWNLAFGSSTWGYTSNAPVKVNEWQHICVTIKDGVATFYYNGTVVETKTSTDFNMPSNIFISPSDYKFTGYFNDIRIYDHCLSKKEVHDIAQALVLHYPLNNQYSYVNLLDNGWGGTANWTTPGNVSTTELPTGLTPAPTHSYKNNISKQYIPIIPSHSYFISAYVKVYGSNSYSYLALIPYDIDKLQIKYENTALGFKTASLTTLKSPLNNGDTVIHLADNTDMTKWQSTLYQATVAIFGYRDSTGHLYSDLTYTQRVFAYRGTGSSVDTGTNIDFTNKTVTLLSPYSGATIPAGTSICLSSYGSSYYYPNTLTAANSQDWTILTKDFEPNNVTFLKYAKYVRYCAMSNNWTAAISFYDKTIDNTVFDKSGFGNNAEIMIRDFNSPNINSISLSTNCKKYDCSYQFINFNYIKRDPLECSSEIKTISFWANWDSIPSGQSVLFVDNGTKTGFGLMSTGILLTTSGAGNSYTYPKSGIVANTWYHFVIVITGATGRDLYINGVKQTATSNTSNWTYSVNQLQIGKRSTTSDGFIGKMSDFRMYATTLSEDDILDLYNASAIVCKNGALQALKFDEQSYNLFNLKGFQTGANNTLSYTLRNGEWAIALPANYFHYGSGDERNIFYRDKFLPNTQYRFDFWIDYDSIVYNDENKMGGIIVQYTDGTNSQALCDTGNQSSPRGWLHKTLTTPAGKSVKGLSIYYWTSVPAYYRWDSMIVPVTNTLDVKKTGVASVGQIREQDTEASVCKGYFDATNFIEI